jgi:hypothetical protein
VCATVLPPATPAYDRYIGIDYSGAETPTSSLKGLRVYLAEHDGGPPIEVPPPPSPRRYWTRRGIAEWLAERLSEDRATIVGIDHGFSFPLRYFEHHMLKPHWPTFLEDFQRHWPTDDDNTYVDFVRDGSAGNGAARAGNAKWRRLTEQRTRAAKSVFHFDVQGTVAKSTHAGLPWLLYLRRRLGARVHFWPFDGWAVPAGKSTMVEVYPALWSHSYPPEGRTPDQHDAYSVAAWVRDADQAGTLRTALEPPLAPAIRGIAEIEGWILETPLDGALRALASPGEQRRLLAAVKPKPKVLVQQADIETFLDCAGKRRRFLLQVYGKGRFLEACEVLGDEVRGSRIVMPVKPGETPPWGELRKRIREQLSRRDLAQDENGRLVLVADGFRGQLTWSDDGVALIVDAVILSWDEVGRLLASHEGFTLHIEIRDPVEE